MCHPSDTQSGMCPFPHYPRKKHEEGVGRRKRGGAAGGFPVKPAQTTNLGVLHWDLSTKASKGKLDNKERIDAESAISHSYPGESQGLAVERGLGNSPWRKTYTLDYCFRAVAPTPEQAAASLRAFAQVAGPWPPVLDSLSLAWGPSLYIFNKWGDAAVGTPLWEQLFESSGPLAWIMSDSPGQHTEVPITGTIPEILLSLSSGGPGGWLCFLNWAGDSQENHCFIG